MVGIMKRQSGQNLHMVIDLLSKDKERNINILNFIQAYPVMSYERVGDSVFIRGESNEIWTYISSDSRNELEHLMNRYLSGDSFFAAVEDWMVPVITKDREIRGEIYMMQYLLPDEVRLPESTLNFVPLEATDAAYVYKNSLYRKYFSLDYVQDRIARGMSVALHRQGQLIAWAITHDDGALGFLHVLPDHRRKGYGYQTILALARKVRKQGEKPFAYIEEDNERAIRLVTQLGFIKQKRVCWLTLD